MSNNLAAYPSLIPGSQEVGEGDWKVIEVDDGLQAGAAGTSKEGRLLKVPKVVLRHDIWIRYHELTHVERPHWKAGKNQLRNLMRQMLEEVALDGQCLNRDGIDLRYARDFYDWSKRKRPEDVYKAAANFFQVWTSAQVSQDAELAKFYQDCTDYLTEAERAEAKLTGLADTLAQAAQAVFNDYSSGNCEDWADIVTAKLLGVPKEEIPDAPEPPGNPGGSRTSDGSTGSGSGSTAEREDGTGAGPRPGETDPAGSGDNEHDGDDSCSACEGQGVDEDGDECGERAGTGTSPGPGAGGATPGTDSDDEAGTGGLAGVPPGAGGADGSDPESGEGHSEWDTPPVELSKDRQNEPSKFGFDPLSKTRVDPNSEPELPPVKQSENVNREQVTQQQLQDAIDQDRINRKQGEASQSAELTAHTPFGGVDVHRHTLTKGTSMSVALGWRSSEMGSTIRYPSQLWTTGRPFAKRAPGGSIILDGSGSMQWHAQHIMDAQKQMPNLYVAVYSYHGGNGYWDASKGFKSGDTFIARYCVLAQKGTLDPEGIEHKSQEWQHTGGNGGADPASLFYAARWAPKPLVWVSDGMVSFGEHQDFYKQCDALMRQHKIVRVLTIEDGIDYLLGKSVPGWHQSATLNTRWVRLGQPYAGQSVSPKETYTEADRWTQLRANARRKR